MTKSIIFMGTPNFSVPILESLILNDEYNVMAVVTQPDRKVGRKGIISPSPVKELSLKYDIPVYQPEKLSGSFEMDQLLKMKTDLIITAAFGQFLPMKLIESAHLGSINVHASLLPKYRGGAPVQCAIMNNDKETGITIIYMVKKMDAGNIISQRSIPILRSDDVGTMFDKLSILGRDTLLNILPKVIMGTNEDIIQDENKVTWAYNIKSEEEQININLSAELFDAKVRGLRPSPGGFIFIDGVRTKIWEVEVLDKTTDLDPGTLLHKDKHLLNIVTGAGGVISILKLQPFGKSKMTVTDYLNGQGKNLKELSVIVKYKQ